MAIPDMEEKCRVFTTRQYYYCAHNGIINTTKRCQEVSGIQEVCTVIGGFHLGFPEVPRDMPACRRVF